MTIRLLCPANGQTKVVNGRTYSGIPGTPVDVPDQDAGILEANGWIVVAAAGVGATSARPANPKKGMEFHDSTLNINIRFDGLVWRNPATGGVV